MWTLVFEKLDDANDLWNCLYTHPAWSELLSKHLADLHIQLALPFLIPYLSKNDLLSVSQVSRVWSKAIDSSIQSAEKFGSEKRLEKDQQIKLYFFHGSFLTKFKNTVTETMSRTSEGAPIAANPMMFRKVKFRPCWDPFVPNVRDKVELKLEIETEEEYEDICDWECNPDREDVPPTPKTFVDFSTQMYDFLESHGHLIRYFTFDIHGDRTHPLLGTINMIRNCLVHMPNLRVLSIKVNSEETPVGRADVLQVNSYLELSPWPEMKHLNVFKSQTDQPQVTTIILNAYGDQLEHITFEENHDITSNYVRLTTRFTSLQSLSLKIYETENVDYFAALTRTRQLPLKTLQFFFRFSLGKKYVKKLVKGVNTLQASLQTLTLQHMCKDKFGSNIEQYWALNLPNLKTLRLILFGYPLVSFLNVVCPSLEHLYVEEWSHTELENQNPGRIYCNLYDEHKIWEKLPDLKSVHVFHIFHYYSHPSLDPDPDGTNQFMQRDVVLKYYRRMYNKYVYYLNNF